MVSRSKVQEHKYYVHYNEQGTIVSVNNHRNNEYDLAVEITSDQHHRLVSGLDRFTDFRIGNIINDNGDAAIGLIPRRVIEEHNFKNRLLKWIVGSCDDADIELRWEGHNSCWLIHATDSFRYLYNNNKLPINKLSLFITLGRDPNFLIRTIDFHLRDLIEHTWTPISFETNWEQNIDLIAVTTNLASLKYSLKIVRTHE